MSLSQHIQELQEALDTKTVGAMCLYMAEDGDSYPRDSWVFKKR